MKLKKTTINSLISYGIVIVAFIICQVTVLELCTVSSLQSSFFAAQTMAIAARKTEIKHGPA